MLKKKSALVADVGTAVCDRVRGTSRYTKQTSSCLFYVLIMNELACIMYNYAKRGGQRVLERYFVVVVHARRTGNNIGKRIVESIGRQCAEVRLI